MITWWRHQMEIFSALLAICAGNSPVTGEFPTQRPETRSFDVYFDLRPKERLSKQWWGWWFETLSRSLWRHRNVDRVKTALHSIWRQHKMSIRTLYSTWVTCCVLLILTVQLTAQQINIAVSQLALRSPVNMWYPPTYTRKGDGQSSRNLALTSVLTFRLP